MFHSIGPLRTGKLHLELNRSDEQLFDDDRENLLVDGGAAVVVAARTNDDRSQSFRVIDETYDR